MEGATLKDVAPLCDVVIAGVPGDKYKFDTSLLREGAVCVNFSSEKVGDTLSILEFLLT
jgi:methylenetetrahydrofolate dehydrogenase (NAD+)